MHIQGVVQGSGAAIAAIVGRRAAAGDDHLEAMSDDGPGVVDYVCTHRGVSSLVLAADALDALVIVRSLRVRLDRQERALIALARDGNKTWEEIAQALGLRSRQAANQRKLRLDAQGAGDRRSELVARVRRRQASREAAWLARHSTDILVLALAVGRSVDGAGSVPEDVQEAAELLRDAAAEPAPSSRELMACLSLLLAAARHSDRQDNLQELGQVEQLVTAWERTRPP